MKRSEMINKLAIKLQQEVMGYEATWASATKDAEDVIEFLEKEGMMPPIVKEKSWLIKPNGEMTYAVHEWEKE